MSYEFYERQIGFNISNRSVRPSKIVIHETDNNSIGAGAENHFKYFASKEVNASADIFIDDHSIWKINDFNKYYCWSVGVIYDTPKRPDVNNGNSISVELCVNRDGNWEVTKQNAIDYIAKLSKETGITDIVTHWDVCVKNCPRTLRATGQVDSFIQAIHNKRNNISNPVPTPVPSNNLSIGVGSKIKIVGNNYATGQSIPQWVKNNTYTIQQINGNKALIQEIISWVYIRDLQLISGGITTNTPSTPSTPSITLGVGSKIKIVGNNYATGQSIPQWVKNNTYTIQQINGNKALIQEIISWVYIKDLVNSNGSTPIPQPVKTLSVGSKIKIIGSNYATGQTIPSWVKTNIYTVQQINGNKALIKEIVSWVYIRDLQIQ